MCAETVEKIKAVAMSRDLVECMLMFFVPDEEVINIESDVDSWMVRKVGGAMLCRKEVAFML